jgi:hypothetical protein
VTGRASADKPLEINGHACRELDAHARGDRVVSGFLQRDGSKGRKVRSAGRAGDEGAHVASATPTSTWSVSLGLTTTDKR